MVIEDNCMKKLAHCFSDFQQKPKYRRIEVTKKGKHDGGKSVVV
jgi:hypothetical protein